MLSPDSDIASFSSSFPSAANSFPAASSGLSLSPDASSVFTLSPSDSLQAAFDSAAPGSVIRLLPGVYREKAVIRTPGLTVCGSGADCTEIVWDDYALKKDSFGRDYNTFRTWTLAVCADDISLRDLSIINDALYPEEKGQEVALSVYGDNFTMTGCTLSSTQDTLFLGPLPPDLIERYDGFLPDELRRPGELKQHFENCLIEGSVDFIFGCGSALFENCEIRSVYDIRGCGYAAAPAHSLSQTSGFLFRGCSFTREEGVTDGSIFLARPWRDSGLAVFENCIYGPHISPLGFDKWNDTSRDKTARFRETPPVTGRVLWCNIR